MPAFRLYQLLPFLLLTAGCSPSEAPDPGYLQISGIYPHLAAYNQPADSAARGGHQECGIGAVAPWAGHLWYITYPPHQRSGSNDKLYMVDPDMNLTIRDESVGGTHANRMIHRESGQLIIGPYFIDSLARVRAADVQRLEGRLTATTRHLFDPVNMVYFYDMEGMVYEVNVHTLGVHRLFEKPVPGWHGKGAYVGQGRLIVANNGEHQGHPMGYSKLLVGGEAQSPEEAGVLAEWDGEAWRIVERKKFTDVTGPGGLAGNEDPDDPVWSMGWDKRSVILKLLDNGEWYTYRLPKASHTFDPNHGWFTEWPRIRAISPERMMMVMHGSMFDFPRSFRRGQSGGIAPIATHLRYIPDFGFWGERVFLAADDASRMQNPIVGQPQSNLWFGTTEDLEHFGPRLGWGGPWINDPVLAGEPSAPFLLQGYAQRMVHLAHDKNSTITFTIEVDAKGDNTWEPLFDIPVGPEGYHAEVLPMGLEGAWLRFRVDRTCQATAYLHYDSPRTEADKPARFAGLANIDDAHPASAGLIRPAGHNRSLQWLQTERNEAYLEVSLDEAMEGLRFDRPAASRAEEVRTTAALDPAGYAVDEASVIVTDREGHRFRLPKGNPQYDSLWSLGRPRMLREVQSERFLANIHGMFYEVPRMEGAGNHAPDYRRMKPVARHDKKITDYCSWRGLLVMTGVRVGAEMGDHIFLDGDGQGLWFGAIDDLWALGKPTGKGGPWLESPVRAGEASDPYLMTGFDRKALALSHDSDQVVRFAVEVAIHHEADAWKRYLTLEVQPGKTLTYTFPFGFQAHWMRLRSDRDCRASALVSYD